MLTLCILAPLLGALALAAIPGVAEDQARTIAIGVATLPLLLLLLVWARFPNGGGFQSVTDLPWIHSLGIAWRVGVDGLSLALALLSAVVFLAAIAWPVDALPRARAYHAWMLFLMGVSLGLFLTLDLILFYVFFDLSLVAMYFLIGRWGHGDSERAALKFFLYTLAGSLLILIGIIMLGLAMPELTFDMRAIIAAHPLSGSGATGALVMLAFLVGFGIKTPLFPFHTWLPPAHVNAPGPVSAILAGVLLKMGAYGLIRLPMQMMPQAFAAFALALGIVAVISILWGAFVALGQDNIKRRIAYTSVNHMGYTVLGIAVAGSALGTEAARAMALTGAVIEMVAHGLITGALFLIAGAFWQRARDYAMSAYGGLAGPAPHLTGAAVLAAFASLGLPGLAGFVAELHIFLGAFAVYPWLAAIGLLGILITAALFLQLLSAVFFGDLPDARRGFPDLSRVEASLLGGLLALVVLIGVWPAWLIDLIDAARLMAGAS